ncbi:hypothetical protein [Sphingosinicella terrae]|jgi:hypothetical protein|uniref:hypothetical protein n=1 Tax=Sphingosinicella terrae TaxID=2172047 RepID=UPI000E0D7056|nr:hypothetical protein [Sphingosinicella terrae]
MPRLHIEALLFCLAWAALAVCGGLLAGWRTGALLSVGLLVVIMPISSVIVTRVESENVERAVRWGLLAAAGIGLLAYLNA